MPWQSIILGSNLSYEGYVGRIKIALLSGNVKDSENVVEILRGFINLTYDAMWTIHSTLNKDRISLDGFINYHIDY